VKKRRSTFREYLEALLIAGIFLGFTNAFVFKTFYIPSASMEKTLLIGDHLFVNRFIFGAESSQLEKALFPLREVQRGDIVIFRSPERPTVDMVKRCVGIPGDTIRVTGKTLFVNGEPVDESGFAVHDRRRSRTGLRSRDDFGPYVVPPAHYFCMGDNRDHSYDSRFWGPVPAHFVKGRAFLVYWSFGGETPDGSWPGWGERLRQLGQTAVSFGTKTRWSRTLHVIR
jgi:signal peptidase I